MFPGLLSLFRGLVGLITLGSSLTSVSLAAEKVVSQNDPPSTSPEWFIVGVGVFFLVGMGLSLKVGYARSHRRKGTPADSETASETASEAVSESAGARPGSQTADIFTNKDKFPGKWANISAPTTKTIADPEAFTYTGAPGWLGRLIIPETNRCWQFQLVQVFGSYPSFQKILLVVAVVSTGVMLWQLAQLMKKSQARPRKPFDPTALPLNWEDWSPSKFRRQLPLRPRIGAPPPVEVFPKMDWVTLVQPEMLGLTPADFQGLTRELLDPAVELSEAQLAQRVQQLVRAFRHWPCHKHNQAAQEDLLESWGLRRPAVLQLLLRVGMAAASPPTLLQLNFRGDAVALPTPLALLPQMHQHLDGSINRELRHLYYYSAEVHESPIPSGDWVSDQLRFSGYWYFQRALAAQGNSALFRSVPLTLLPSPFLSTLFREYLRESARKVQPAYLALRDEQQQPDFGTSRAALVYWHCLAEQAGAQTFRALEGAAFGVSPPRLHRWLLRRQALGGPVALAHWRKLLRDPARTLELPPPALAQNLSF